MLRCLYFFVFVFLCSELVVSIPPLLNSPIPAAAAAAAVAAAAAAAAAGLLLQHLLLLFCGSTDVDDLLV